MFEKDENGKNKDGFYKHKETGQIVELIDDPTYGVPLTNAYIKVGFEFIGTEDPRVTVSNKTDKEVPSKKTK